MDEQLHELIRKTVRSIPYGKVATYGDVATAARAPSARLVGRVLAEDGIDLPWHRVLRANGTCAPHLADQQLQLLAAEGVIAYRGTVDLSRYRWAEAKSDEPDHPSLW